MYGEMDQPRKLSRFIWVLDIERLMLLDRFKRRLGEMLHEFSALWPAHRFERVCYPGQIERERRQQRAGEGIPIDAGLFQ